MNHHRNTSGTELRDQRAVVAPGQIRLPQHHDSALICQAIFDSFSVNSSGLARFEVRPGISDCTALLMVASKLAGKVPGAGLLGIHQSELRWYAAQEQSALEQSHETRIKQVQLIVPVTIGRTRSGMEQLLTLEGLRFATPIEQALTAIVSSHCMSKQDPFEGRWARGSLPGVASNADGAAGVVHYPFTDSYYNVDVAASGAIS